MKSNRLKKHLCALAVLVLVQMEVPLVAQSETISTPALAKPTADQMAFMDMEMGVFFHFGINTFTSEEHGDGKHAASMFNPTQLDCDQWVRTAKSMGAKYAVLTARHEEGFCLWPTATTKYSINSSPYNGKGDIVRDFVNACHKYGLKVGLYHPAPSDRQHTFKTSEGEKCQTDDDGVNDPTQPGAVGAAKYNAMQLAQLEELFTNYGEISYLWCDGWNKGDLWQAAVEKVHQLQPHCLILGPDVWPAGPPANEAGVVTYPNWSAINTVDGTMNTRPSPADWPAGNPLGTIWRCREADTTTGFNRGGWFWNSQKTAAKPLADHIALYYRTVGLGVNIIINLPPDNRGLIQDDLVAAAKELGEVIQKRFANPIAESSHLPAGDTVELSWEKPGLIDTVVSMENLTDGQKVASYTLEAWVDGKWAGVKSVNEFLHLKEPPFNAHPGFETIGHKKIDRIEPVTTNRLRFRCLKSIAQPVEMRRLAVFNCEHTTN